MAEPAQQFEPSENKEVYDNPGGESSKPTPDLRSMEGGGEGDGVPSGNLHSAANDNDEDNKSKSPEELRDAERSDNNPTSAGNESSESGAGGDIPYSEEGPTRRQRIVSGALFGIGSGGGGKGKSKVSSMSKVKRKLLFGAGIGGGGFVFVILILLLLLASSLKIPDLAQHITEYEFARITRQFAQSADTVTEQDLAVQATDNSVYASLKKQYQNLRDNTWGKLDKYRPSKVIQNLGGDNAGLKLNTKLTALGRTYLDSVELDGTTYVMNQTSGFTRFVPVISDISDFKNQVTFSRDFAPDLIQAMKDDDIGVIVRSQVAKQIRQKLGISLIAWTVAKYQGKNPQQAEDQINRDAYDDVNEGGITQSQIDEINQAATESNNQIKSDVANNKSLENIAAQDGFDQAAANAASKTLGSGILKDVTSVLNPAYAVALPACIVYQGSLTPSSGDTIDTQTAEQQRSFYFVADAADQQKYGTEPNDSQDGLATAVGATNVKLGDITLSNPEMRSSGNNVDTSVTALSAESSPLGQFTLFNAIPGLSSASGLLNSIANDTCPYLTNLALGISTGIVIQIGSLIADVFSGGAPTEAEVAGEAAANGVVDATTSSIFSRIASGLGSRLVETFGKDSVKDIGLRDVLGKVRQTFSDLAKQSVKLVGITVAAKLLVLADAHQNYNGLEQGADFANEADSGGNIHANELERSELFGRPLAQNEVCTSGQEDSQFIVAQQSSKSVFDRYLATSNADSLLSRSAIAVSSKFNGSIFRSLIDFIGSVLSKPSVIFSSFANLFNHKAFASTCPNDNSNNYGNVQFGWSQDEENLIKSNESYLPLENQQILDSSGQEKAIAKKYAICFGYKYNASGESLDPTDSNSNLTLDDGIGGTASIGTLLANGAIVRDQYGNVINSGKAVCSPNQLDQTNNEFGSQMVFRWRLAMRYDMTLNQLTQEANL